MEIFDPYAHALAALALWAVLVCVLSMLSTVGRTAEARCECGKPKRDYSDPVYRRERAFMNAVEGGGPFVAVTLAAILSGASPFMVNLFASVYLLARIGMAFVHIKTENQPARSVFFLIGLISILGLVISVLRAVF
ncbi:MAPEG family protein [uncultured Sulfitobacter sp.]|uniref:MAPEG family protein n=1 Tax=uncultured Sulfitobacter sp. TaxID=191468 RepID=UPI002632B8D8|nr:MAPEG family protein [uncultured Sulfitobacter sp.]